MVKVLYIGHYREGTSWSQAAIDYILSLDAAGVDVVCRPVKLNDSKQELPQRILELESKSSSGATHCIQHVLPHYMDFNGKLYNIGLFVTETDSIAWTGWPSRLKTMDELWVPNTEMQKMCQREVPNVPVNVVPHAADISKYDKEYPEFDLSMMGDRHLFYFVGEFIKRKRIHALLQAYYLAFDRNDNVGLVIKTNKTGMNEQQLLDEISNIDRIVKEKLRLYPNERFYPPVLFITSWLTEEQLCALHQRCNTFVTLSYGDAWCIPAFDAVGFKNRVISSDCGGMKDFLRVAGYCNRMVKGTWEPVFGADMILQDLNTGRENWFNASINDAVDAMREEVIFEGLYKCGFQAGQEMEGFGRITEYSYENIGLVMKDLLNETTRG